MIIGLPGTALIRRQEGIWQGHLYRITGMLAVIHELVCKEDVIINTTDKERGEGHNKDELPVRKKGIHQEAAWKERCFTTTIRLVGPAEDTKL